MSLLREYIKLILEQDFMDDVIEIDGQEVGNLRAVIHEDQDRVRNWLESEQASEDVIQRVLNLPGPWGIIRNMNVYEEHRGKSYGNQIMDRAFDFCANCSTVMLICDTGESNDFDLCKWYQGFGFEPIVMLSSGPLMVLE